MTTVQRIKELKMVPIGNSKGIRLPKAMIDKYGFKDLIQVEEVENGIFLRKKPDDKLSWEDTYQAMREEKEEWSDFDDTVDDGLEEDGFET